MRFLLVDDVRPILDEETSLLKELMPESVKHAQDTNS